MKKVIFSLAIVLLSSAVCAQKANVSKAKNKALSVETPDFEGAREAIKLALVDPTTKDLADTWYVAGLIGYKENEALYLKATLNQKYDEMAKGAAILESYNYFLKADELGLKPDEKGKVSTKIRKEVQPKVQEYYMQPSNLIAYGALLFENKQYNEAVNVFETWLAIPNLPMMQDEKSQAKMPRDTTYSQIKYYVAIAASNGGMNQKAVDYLTDLKDEAYETKLVYQLLYQKQFENKDTVAFVQTLKEGMDRFPSEPWFLQNLINHYVFSNQTNEALVYLNKAIEKDPTVAQYHYIKGNLNETLGKADDAIVSFKKALELDPKMADAEAGIGRVYFNQAVKVNELASNIQDAKQYKVELQRSQDLFKQSLPYFEKASQMAPDDMDHKRTLRQLYYRLGMDKEYEAIGKELGY